MLPWTQPRATMSNLQLSEPRLRRLVARLAGACIRTRRRWLRVKIRCQGKLTNEGQFCAQLLKRHVCLLAPVPLAGQKRRRLDAARALLQPIKHSPCNFMYSNSIQLTRRFSRTSILPRQLQHCSVKHDCAHLNPSCSLSLRPATRLLVPLVSEESAEWRKVWSTSVAITRAPHLQPGNAVF